MGRGDTLSIAVLGRLRQTRLDAPNPNLRTTLPMDHGDTPLIDLLAGSRELLRPPYRQILLSMIRWRQSLTFLWPRRRPQLQLAAGVIRLTAVRVLSLSSRLRKSLGRRLPAHRNIDQRSVPLRQRRLDDK